MAKIPKPCKGCSTSCYNWQMGDCREYEEVPSEEDALPEDIRKTLLEKAFEYASNRPPETESHIRQEAYIAGAVFIYKRLISSTPNSFPDYLINKNR